MTIGVKSTDHSQRSLEAVNDRLRQTVRDLEEKLSRLKAFLQKELDYTPGKGSTATLSTGASLGQNQPNPSGETTSVPVVIHQGPAHQLI